MEEGEEVRSGISIVLLTVFECARRKEFAINEQLNSASFRCVSLHFDSCSHSSPRLLLPYAVDLTRCDMQCDAA